MGSTLHGSELLLLEWIRRHPLDWKMAKEKLKDHWMEYDEVHSDIPGELFYLCKPLLRRPTSFWQILAIEPDTQTELRLSDSLLTRYISINHFTEFRLDNCFCKIDRPCLPKEIFRCTNLRHLSLKNNSLSKIPPDIGRLQKLTYLALTNNRLHVRSIPYTLVFCVCLETLMVDYNLLDALPAFLLEMTSLETVHRIGQHTTDAITTFTTDYVRFRPTLTFMPTHRDGNHRVIRNSGVADYKPGTSLAFWAAKALIASKTNFLSDSNMASVLKDFVCDIYEQFNVCHTCTTASLINQQGFNVVSFKSSYLGNTCVPFEYWVCSIECTSSVEVSSRSDDGTRRELQKAFDMSSRTRTYQLFTSRTSKCTLM